MAQAEIAGDEIRIVIADDHPSYARGVGLLLNSMAPEIELVGTAGSAAEAIKLVEKSVPDLILMDIQMPGGGIEATRQISEEFPAVKVVMLTVSEDDEDIFDAMKAGASGFLPKQVEVDELVAAIRAVHRGQVVVSPLVADKLLRSAPDERVGLLDVERSLLKLVAEGRDNPDIGREMGMSEATVKRVLKNVVQKLHLHNRVQAAVYAAKKGWV
ncbi:MAG: response regulator transcription factor [Actinobacteria bacterium]|nr:response regulator transcription factor [Actinomycetota bacterium]